MEDPSSEVAPTATAAPATRNPLTEPEQHLKCPRCDSTNTKFCYYNNYNLSQPRHFCKDCRRYWTKGGSLRNIPVGGGTRRAATRRPSPSSSSPTTAANNNSASCGLKRRSTSPTASPSSNAAKRVLKPEPISGAYPSPAEVRDQLLELSGPISPLLTANGVFGELLFNVSHPNGPSAAAARTIPDSGFMGWELFPPPPPPQQQNRTSGDECNGSDGVAPVVEENFLGLLGDSSCWGNISNGGDGWPDLAIYAPGSNFQ